MTETADITLWLGSARNGDRAALDQVLSTLYQELHTMARRQLSGHGAFGIAKAKQPRQIGLNVPLGDGFGPAKVGILPAQKFGQLRKIAAVGLERGW